MDAMNNERVLEIAAEVENLDAVTAFIEEALESADCPMKVMMKVALAVEEVFVNIASYAYAPEHGMAKVIVRLYEEPRRAEITFEDSGIPYDPLKRDDPDITLAMEERDIGGLGVFLTRRSMDEVRYEYDGRNILTMIKSF